MIPALGRQRQVDLCEFKISLVYRVSSRTVRTVTQRNPVSKTNKQTNKQTKATTTTKTKTNQTKRLTLGAREIA